MDHKAAVIDKPWLWTRVRSQAARALGDPGVPRGDNASVTALQGNPSGAEHAMRLRLALDHFRGLTLTPQEARRLSTAIIAVIRGTGTFSVGPLAASGRRYRFERRDDLIHIRVGNAAIRLSVPLAKSLAGELAAA